MNSMTLFEVTAEYNHALNDLYDLEQRGETENDATHCKKKRVALNSIRTDISFRQHGHSEHWKYIQSFSLKFY